MNTVKEAPGAATPGGGVLEYPTELIINEVNKNSSITEEEFKKLPDVTKLYLQKQQERAKKRSEDNISGNDNNSNLSSEDNDISKDVLHRNKDEQGDVTGEEEKRTDEVSPKLAIKDIANIESFGNVGNPGIFVRDIDEQDVLHEIEKDKSDITGEEAKRTDEVSPKLAIGDLLYYYIYI